MAGRTLARGGVKRIDVVTGFMTDMVDERLQAIRDPRVEITTRFNPFYKVADNLGSCWIAREAMEGDFLILNGDTLVSEEIVARVQQDSGWPIAVTVDVKPAYDSDDMKSRATPPAACSTSARRSPPPKATPNSIGFLAFRGEGADLFRNAVRAAMRTPEGGAALVPQGDRQPCLDRQGGHGVDRGARLGGSGFPQRHRDRDAVDRRVGLVRVAAGSAPPSSRA